MGNLGLILLLHTLIDKNKSFVVGSSLVKVLFKSMFSVPVRPYITFLLPYIQYTIKI